MKYKAQLLDEGAMRRALTRLSYEIVEKSTDMERILLVGIHRRGLPLANIIAENIQKNSGFSVKTAALDITLYRDDKTPLSDAPQVKSIHIPWDINGMEVVLVDDVLFTGRTIRAAIEALFSIGRPGKIRLAVLIDRGHRELPFRADYVGKNIPTSLREEIRVNLAETDGKTNVEIYEND